MFSVPEINCRRIPPNWIQRLLHRFSVRPYFLDQELGGVLVPAAGDHKRVQARIRLVNRVRFVFGQDRQDLLQQGMCSMIGVRVARFFRLALANTVELEKFQVTIGAEHTLHLQELHADTLQLEAHALDGIQSIEEAFDNVGIDVFK